MERIALGANACWFKSGDPAFKAYSLAPELTSFSGRPRILLVRKGSADIRPLLVVQAEGKPARLDDARFSPEAAAMGMWQPLRFMKEGYAGIYPGFCRNACHPDHDAAIRLRVPELDYHFIDRVQGEFRQHLGREVGDFVIRRRDCLFAYQLAVVLDDAWQGVTDVVRGADLLDSTPRQLYLQELLGLQQPRYLHVPLIIQPDGHKLGKSYRSPPLPVDQASPLLLRALRALGQQPTTELQGASPGELLAWGIANWDATRIPRSRTLAEAQLK